MVSLRPFQLPPPSQGVVTKSGSMNPVWYRFLRDFYGWIVQKHVPTLPSVTTAERDAIDATNGMMIYNSTTDQIEGYYNSTWNAL